MQRRNDPSAKGRKRPPHSRRATSIIARPLLHFDPLQPPAPQASLPFFPTRFIDRQRELAQLAELVKVKPIVTVIGVPGCGKSRFALEFARCMLEPYEGAVVWVSLTSVSSSTLVSQSVASAFGIREPGQQSVTQAIADQLLDKPCLLVIDNCSHHKRAVGALAAALTQVVPRLRILVTSRAVLGIVGETVFPLLPLAPPPTALSPSPNRW